MFKNIIFSLFFCLLVSHHQQTAEADVSQIKDKVYNVLMSGLMSLGSTAGTAAANTFTSFSKPVLGSLDTFLGDSFKIISARMYDVAKPILVSAGIFLLMKAVFEVIKHGIPYLLPPPPKVIRYEYDYHYHNNEFDYKKQKIDRKREKELQEREDELRKKQEEEKKKEMETDELTAAATKGKGDVQQQEQASDGESEENNGEEEPSDGNTKKESFEIYSYLNQMKEFVLKHQGTIAVGAALIAGTLVGVQSFYEKPKEAHGANLLDVSILKENLQGTAASQILNAMQDSQSQSPNYQPAVNYLELLRKKREDHKQ